MVRVEDLSKVFSTERGDIQAVDKVSFVVEAGEILGFLGPNGAGKSTTMKMMTGFLPITEGRVLYDEKSIETSPIECQRIIGYVPENAPLYGEMTVTEFLNFCGEVRSMKKIDLCERLRIVIELCHLEGVEHQRLETLSKGYRRRVSIAQALIHDPPILILDEPTDGLDPNQKHEVRMLLKKLALDPHRPKSIIVSTHILEEVPAICTKVVVISKGKACFMGTPDEFSSLRPGQKIDEVFRQLTLGDMNA